MFYNGLNFHEKNSNEMCAPNKDDKGFVYKYVSLTLTAHMANTAAFDNENISFHAALVT
jgi:hypothetical protein